MNICYQMACYRPKDIKRMEKIKQRFLDTNPGIKKVIWLTNGDMNWICQHGISHTVYAPDSDFEHRCCGCCKDLVKVTRDAEPL